MAEGTVLWFNSEKGVGAVRPDGWTSPPVPSRRWWRGRRNSTAPPAEAGEIPVHYAEIQMRGFKVLNAGQRVSFAIAQGPNGPVATHVTPLSGPWPYES
ncbi:cold-shock protein [Amycolatopsis roodepoortensis]|uniref:CspA family cold shock protein n=1 Tax=Amycolatopsis roodepoortensis TaxID=700274 RepID=A0ABR9LJS8_9PSEU|nr:cold shock domain-containing protein [Amycolatopsis roodepoortensis]MBE1580331.1 CspA family cold shock protein [Amycolatopsis roodepoortensis]